MSGLGLRDLAPPGRPYVVVNFVASADGKATFEGRSGKLGGEADSALFHRLRTQADAVLVGSGTLRAERYGRIVRDPELRAAREAEGLAPDPLACVVSRSLSLPLDIPLFQDPEQRTIVFTSSDERLEGAGPGVSVERLRAEELTLTSALQVPARPPRARSVLCEGGPSCSALCWARSWWTSPPLAGTADRGGGEAPTIVEGMPLAELLELELVWVLEAEGRVVHLLPDREIVSRAAAERVTYASPGHPGTPMAISPVPTAEPEALTGALAEARERTLALVASISDGDLERVHSQLMSPLVWDLGHIAAFEDLWLVHRFGGDRLLRGDLAEVYDAFETPRAERGDLPSCAAPTRRLPRRGARAHARRARRARRRRRRSCTSWSCATSTSTTRRCSRRWSWRG